MYCPALRIDIQPIGRSMPDVHCGAKLLKQRRSYGRGGTIGTVQTDTQIAECLILKGLSEEIDITLYTTVIEERTSNSFPGQRRLRRRALEPSFNGLLKCILQFCP